MRCQAEEFQSQEVHFLQINSFTPPLVLEATQSYLSGTGPRCGQKITRKNHVKTEKNSSSSKILINTVRLSKIHINSLKSVSIDCLDLWRARMPNQSFNLYVWRQLPISYIFSPNGWHLCIIIHPSSERSTYKQKHVCSLFLSNPGKWRSGSRTEGWKRRSWKKRCFSTTQHTTRFDEGWSENGADVTSKSSTNCDNGDDSVNEARISNVSKHPLNNSFFIEFMMHVFFWCDFILLRLFFCLSQAFSIKDVLLFFQKYINKKNPIYFSFNVKKNCSNLHKIKSGPIFFSQ